MILLNHVVCISPIDPKLNKSSMVLGLSSSSSALIQQYYYNKILFFFIKFYVTQTHSFELMELLHKLLLLLAAKLLCLDLNLKGITQIL